MNINHLSQLTEEQLDEVRMSPTALKKFADSPEARGIRAGFEAEVIFAGLGGGGEDYESEPDYDMDQRARDIDEIIDFFSGGDMGMGRAGRERLRERLTDDYHEWQYEQLQSAWNDNGEEYLREYIEENDEFDYEEAVREALEDMDLESDDIDDAMALGLQARKFTSTAQQRELAEQNPMYEKYLEAAKSANEALEDFVQSEWSGRGRIYDQAWSQYEEENIDDYDERSWLDETDNDRMSYIADNYNLDWPYWYTPESESSGNEYNEENAQHLAQDFQRTFRDQFPDMRVRTGSYQSHRPKGEWGNTWYFESDGSLSADDYDDMPCEIISPPMPLETTLAFLPEFWAWVKTHDGYTNESTGFHMSVSLPGRGTKQYPSKHRFAGRAVPDSTYDIDLVKLIMFLGDKHLLEQFDRIGNTYCEAALPKLQHVIENNPAKAEQAMTLMKNNLIELAGNTLKQGDFGKYTSINPKTKYVEFRIAGNEGYEEDIEKLQNTLLRYAYALHIAGNNNLYRDEYAKKLMKALSPSSFTHHNEPGKRQTRIDKSEADLLQTFALFSAGVMTKQELIDRVRPEQLSREIERGGDEGKQYWWRVQRRGSYGSVELVAKSKAEAIEKGREELQLTHIPAEDFTAKPIRHYTAKDAQDEQDRLKAVAARDELSKTHDVTPNNSGGDLTSRLDNLSSRLNRLMRGEDEPETQSSQSSGGEWTGRWRIIDSITGEPLYTFGGIGNSQADANRHAAAWVRRTGFDDPIEVYPEMAPVVSHPNFR